MLNVTARPNVMHSYYTERQFYVKLNYITRKLHTLSSTLPAAANNILATALPSTPADQQLRVPQHCLDQQKQSSDHVRPSLFVPVKCALAVMNWHCYIPLPHLSLLPLYSPAPFHAHTHTFLSLPECYWRRAWTDQHLSVTHISTTKITHGLTCHSNL